MYLKDKILEIGVGKCMFIAPFRPVSTIMGISFTSSNDPTFDLPATINEKRYKVDDGYKITLECTISGFGKEHFYQMDLKYLIEKGIVIMFQKVNF